MVEIINIRNFLKKKIMILDGATGTELQKLACRQVFARKYGVWTIRTSSALSTNRIRKPVHRLFIPAPLEPIAINSNSSAQSTMFTPSI